MKNSQLSRLIRLFAMPAVLILLGLILIAAPDYAAMLCARVISVILTASGIGYGVIALLGGPSRRAVRIVTAAFCLILGSALLTNPLILAANIGRVLGITLAFEGIQSLAKHSTGKPMALLTLAGAVVLITAPMTASRLVFTLCGTVVVAIGIAQLLERLRRGRWNREEDDPNIIDAL